MTSAIELDGYCQRIGYTAERRATLDMLRAIHVGHPEAIAFENLKPLLKWPIRLDAPSLQQKLVRAGRGGYCFEQNLLLSNVLTGLGFKVSGLGARVLWNAPEGAITPRGHMLLRIDLDWKPYVADAGAAIARLRGHQLVSLEPPGLALRQWPHRGTGGSRSALRTSQQ